MKQGLYFISSCKRMCRFDILYIGPVHRKDTSLSGMRVVGYIWTIGYLISLFVAEKCHIVQGLKFTYSDTDSVRQ